MNIREQTLKCCGARARRLQIGAFSIAARFCVFASTLLQVQPQYEPNIFSAFWKVNLVIEVAQGLPETATQHRGHDACQLGT